LCRGDSCIANVRAEMRSSNVPDAIIVDMNLCEDDWKMLEFASVFSESRSVRACSLSASSVQFDGVFRVFRDSGIESAGNSTACQSDRAWNFY
jgi:hypothetical protein